MKVTGDIRCASKGIKLQQTVFLIGLDKYIGTIFIIPKML